MPTELEAILLFICIFALGFFTGCACCIRKHIAELKEFEGRLLHIRELGNKLDDERVKYINELLAENKQLKTQLNYYKLGGNSNNGSVLE